MRAPHGSRAGGAPSATASGGDRVLADDDGVGDFGDLVGRHAGVAGVAADRLRAHGLVDAGRPQLAVLLLDDITANPTHLVAHLFPLGRGFRGGRLQRGGVGPVAAAANQIEIHLSCSFSIVPRWAADLLDAPSLHHELPGNNGRTAVLTPARGRSARWPTELE